MPGILDHIGPVKTVNDSLAITPVGEPGAGGAFVKYEIADKVEGAEDHKIRLVLEFQNGMPDAVGVNGITNEVLCAILIDRFKGFQAGPFACVENAEALRGFLESMQWMKRRAKRVYLETPPKVETPKA